jgi:hypothetical protein
MWLKSLQDSVSGVIGDSLQQRFKRVELLLAEPLQVLVEAIGK